MRVSVVAECLHGRGRESEHEVRRLATPVSVQSAMSPAPASTGSPDDDVVTTANVEAALFPILPLKSTCSACAVYVPRARAVEGSTDHAPLVKRVVSRLHGRSARRRSRGRS